MHQNTYAIVTFFCNPLALANAYGELPKIHPCPQNLLYNAVLCNPIKHTKTPNILGCFGVFFHSIHSPPCFVKYLGETLSTMRMFSAFFTQAKSFFVVGIVTVAWWSQSDEPAALSIKTSNFTKRNALEESIKPI